MARTIRNAKIDSRSARAKLNTRREPYWTPITPGCALGYRKGKTGGSWIAKRYDRKAATMRVYKALGPADDAMDPDGAAALSFAQAQQEAHKWFAEQAREAQGHGLTSDEISQRMTALAEVLEELSYKGSDEAAEMRDAVATRMTSDQIPEAQRMAREWLERREIGG